MKSKVMNTMVLSPVASVLFNNVNSTTTNNTITLLIVLVLIIQ